MDNGSNENLLKACSQFIWFGYTGNLEKVKLYYSLKLNIWGIFCTCLFKCRHLKVEH